MQRNLSVFLFHAVQNDFFRVCHQYQTKRIGLMVRDFLRVWIFRPIGIFSALTLIQHFKTKQLFEFRCCRLRDHPCGIEIPDRLQTRHYGGFQAGRGQYDKIMGKRGILRFIVREIQFQIEKRRH